MSDPICNCVCHALGDDRKTCSARGCCAAYRKGYLDAIDGAAWCLCSEAVGLEARAADLRKEGRHVLALARNEQAELYRSASQRVRMLAPSSSESGAKGGGRE